MAFGHITILLYVLAAAIISTTQGCQFYPIGEYLRFVRVPENLPVGGEVLTVEVHPRRNLILQPVDKATDVEFFKYRAVNKTSVSVRLARSLEDLVDSPSPQNVLKFRLVCDYDDGNDMISSYLSVTVYVEDINDHDPEFVDAPYKVSVDELTPTGITIFKGIQAIDRDKPNTPNSDVQYSILEGNEEGKFALESSHRAAVVLRKPLDYDAGDVQFILTLLASDRGSPPRNSTTVLTVSVNDNDDLNPKFTKDVYRVQIPEFYPITGKRIHQEIKMSPPIHAEDQDRALNATIRYDLIAGNERHLFSLDLKNGSLFLEKELDLEALPGNTFTLQIQASQLENPLKAGLARVEIELLDINDNQPQFEVDVYNISIVENLPNGFSVLQVVATDQDQGDNGEFIYHLVDPSQAFNIDSHSGWLTVRNQAKLDRETRPSLGMRVYAREKLPSVISQNLEGDSFVSVEVTLLDANDNNPMFFPTNLYEFSVPTNAPIGQTVGKVEARDPDLGRNGMVLYDLQRGNLSSSSKPLLFSVDAQSGKISVADSPLPSGRHALFVEASDQPVNPSERRYSLAVVTVEVTTASKGNTIPDFIGAPYEFWVGSDVSIGTSVGQIRLNDAIDHSKIVYDLLHSYHEGVPFAVEERSGTITVVDEMRKFGRVLYDFEAVVTDEKETTLATNVTIHLVESEFGTPFTRTSTEPITMEFRVRENLSGALVGQLLKGKPKSDRIGNFTVEPNRWRSQRFIIASQPDVLEQFAISQDGTIYTQKGLDRETKDTYQLTIIGENNNGITRGGEIYQVKVNVEDENDNPPVFEKQWYKGYVKENVVALTDVKLDQPIKARDADLNVNAQFKMSLRGEGSELFILDQTTGNLLVKSDASLDRETKDTYTLRIIARDRGNLSSEARVTIHIEDVNDNAPRFVQMVVHQRDDVDVIKSTGDPNNLNVITGNSTILKTRKNLFKEPSAPIVFVPENIPVGTNLLKLNAVDKDIGENAIITYSIKTEAVSSESKQESKKRLPHFTIHPTTGELSIASFLPPETEFRLNISAEDTGGLSGFTIIKVYVKDVNDNAPVFSKPWYNFEISEGTYTNHVLGQVEATDADFGENANVTYAILQKHDSSPALPFTITSSGTILINGELDRETIPSYLLRVIAQDNGPLNSRLRTTVDVEIHVSDVNDNPPMFYSYDRLLKIPASDFMDDVLKAGEKFEGIMTVPVYYASIVENSTPGVPIARVFANDSDFMGNGNGMILFDIARRRNTRDLFTIDSKEGVISTIVPLDFETQKIHNVTIIASDLGKPSLSSTALLVVNVIDVPEVFQDDQGPMFAHRYYELEVEENCPVPLEILALNVSAEHREKLVGAGGLRFSIVQEEGSGFFQVDSRNGSLYLVNSPDREKINELVVRVRVDRITKRGKTLHMIYPIQPDALVDVAPNEVKVIVKILDINDNAPRFIGNGRPLVAAIPTTASYGYPIVRLQAKDPDQGINGEIRYHILGQEEAKKFAVDPITGQIRSVASFVRDAGRVFGFDVKAVDKNGAEDGRYAIANVFVFVLDEQKKLAMVIEARPMEIEERMENITLSLSNITGFDVRVRKLEPHLDILSEEPAATDLYLYAVDPLMNTIIDNDILSNSLMAKEKEVRSALEPYNIMEVASVSPIVVPVELPKTQRPILTGLEVMTIILGCIVFVGALTAAVCVGCIHRNKDEKNLKTSNFTTNSMAEIAFGLTPKSPHILNCKPRSLFHPSSFLEDSTDSYTEMTSECHRHRHRQHHRHEPTCARHQSRRRKNSLARSPSTAILQASLASLHSSGRDSGIGKNMGRCPCGHSATHSSANSSNGSYEDSLKSLHRQHSHSSGSGGGCSHDRSMLRRQQQYNTPSLTRRPSERILVCPMTN